MISPAIERPLLSAYRYSIQAKCYRSPLARTSDHLDPNVSQSRMKLCKLASKGQQIAVRYVLIPTDSIALRELIEEYKHEPAKAARLENTSLTREEKELLLDELVCWLKESLSIEEVQPAQVSQLQNIFQFENEVIFV